MVRSIVLVGGQEVPPTEKAIAMKYAQQLKTKDSLARYNSLVEGFSSGSNLSTFDFATNANLSIDYSARENLSCDYSNSEDGDLVESPLLAVIEKFILGQRKNQSTSLVSYADDVDDSGSSVFSFESENEFSFSQSGVNHVPKATKEPVKQDAMPTANQAVDPNTDNSPSNASRQRLKRWRQLLQPKLRKANENSIVKDEVPSLAIHSEVPTNRTAASVAEQDNTEFGMFSSESMEESTILIVSRNSTLSTFQKPKGPINSCLPFDAMLRCGPQSAQLRKFTTDSYCEPSEFSPVMVKLKKGTSKPGEDDREQPDMHHHNEAQTMFSVPLTKALSFESMEETEIVFCESDDFSVGNDEKLWDNPRLWERWAPTEAPVADEAPIASSPPTRRARSLQNPVVEKIPQQEFHKSRTSDVCVPQPNFQILPVDDMKAQFSLLRDEGVEIVQSNVLKENEKAVPTPKKPKSPLEKKMAPFIAHLRSPRNARLPPLAPRTATKAPAETSNRSILIAEPQESHQETQQPPVLCPHCQHKLHQTRGLATLPTDAERHIAKGCNNDKINEQATQTTAYATLSTDPTSMVPLGVDPSISQQNETVVILDGCSKEPDLSFKEECFDVNDSSQRQETVDLVTSGSSAPSPCKDVAPAPTASNGARPLVKLSIETTRQDQSTALECTSRSSKPWSASAKFQEVAPKIDFLDGADEIELVREAPVRLPSRFFWQTRRFRSLVSVNDYCAGESDSPLKSTQAAQERKPSHSNGLTTPIVPTPLQNSSEEAIKRVHQPFGLVKSLFQPSTRNDECAVPLQKSGSVKTSLQRLGLLRQKGRRSYAPSPISVIASVSRPTGANLDETERTRESDGPVPETVVQLLGELPETAPLANTCPDIEPCQTYDEALALEQAKQQVHAENGRISYTDYQRQHHESPVTLYPFIDFNPCKEELRGDNSFDTKNESVGVKVSSPFKAADTQVARPRLTQTAQMGGRTALVGVRDKADRTSAKEVSARKKAPLSLYPELTKSDSSNSFLKKVLRRLAKHRVAFKEDIDESIQNAFISRLDCENEGTRDVGLDVNAYDVVLRQLALPNTQESKKEKKAEIKPTATPRRPDAVKRKKKLKAKYGVSHGENKVPHHDGKTETLEEKPEVKAINSEKCAIVRELVLSPSDTTRTSVRFTEPTSHIPRSRKKRRPVVNPNDVEAIKRRSDETVATGATKTSALSGVSRLTMAERKLARRLASDINILAKIEKKRRVMGKPGSTTKTQEIEKSLKLLQSINASRQERKIKEAAETQERDDMETTPEEPSFANLFGVLSVFGK